MKHIQIEHDNCDVNNVKFSWKVLRSFTKPLERQITEAVHISEKDHCENLNSKSEFNGPPQKRLGLGGNLVIFQCKTCSAKFQHDNELKKHHNLHNMPIKCEYRDCEYSAIGKYDIKQHQQRVHEDSK